uniref:Uncharacterized protein n=1 Tax=Myoviridae sp. ctijX18 TaxID=2825154 RepID=A0A8S5UT21_9CAUD|nr:MAG TPA: hypothetical protein [Myoviridae sp. ctijX18]DAQ61252.1 MAG TPA: hypothetical protein [Caudoviricetes sp.]
MENTLTKLENLAEFIVLIHKYYRDYYGMSVADIAHPRHRHLDARVTKMAFTLNNVFLKSKDRLDIISFNQIYGALNYVDSTDLIKIICGQRATYEQHFKRLLVEYLMVQSYDANLMVNKLKDLVLKYIEEDANAYILKDFNSKGKGFKVVDNDDIFFKVLKQGRFKNHPLRKQLESLTAEYREPGIAIPVFADENDSGIVSGAVSRVYIIDAEPRVDISAIDNSTLTSLVENRTQETCDHYILYPIFHKKKSSVADPNSDYEVISNINSLIGFRMMINEAYVDTLDKLREEDGVYQPLYRSIPLKGDVVIGDIEVAVPSDPFIVKTPEVPLENIKETKMKVATFELNDTFKLLEYLEANDVEKEHTVSKRIQDMSGEHARPIPVIRNLVNKDDIGDILVITNNEPEGYVSDIICRDGAYWVTVSAYPGTKLEEMVEKYQKGETSLLKFHPNYIADEDVPDEIDEESVDIIRSLHCFDYREVTPAKVLKFKK